MDSTLNSTRLSERITVIQSMKNYNSTVLGVYGIAVLSLILTNIFVPTVSVFGVSFAIVLLTGLIIASLDCS